MRWVYGRGFFDRWLVALMIAAYAYNEITNFLSFLRRVELQYHGYINEKIP
jgi:hypothetical protein